MKRLIASLLLMASATAVHPDTNSLRVRLLWGYTAAKRTPYFVKLVPGTVNSHIANQTGYSLEKGEGATNGAWQTTAGKGDTDGIQFVLQYSSPITTAMRKEQSIWSALLAQSDPDTVARLKADPAFQVDPPTVVVQTNPEGTRGFAFTPDQLRHHRAIWVPDLDMYLTLADAPVTFADHQKTLKPFAGHRILDQVRAEPEASYEQYTARWEDMGSPRYRNPQAQGPGHIVCLTWDSAIPKFGVDRRAGVWPDYGNPDKFRLEYDLRDAGSGNEPEWQAQRLTDGLPVITTVLAAKDRRFEIEQFAYPLHGPPSERRGDIAMTLLQRLTIANTADTPQSISFVIRHRREYPAGSPCQLTNRVGPDSCSLTEAGSGRILLAIQGAGAQFRIESDQRENDNDPKKPVRLVTHIRVTTTLAAGAATEVMVKLPSPATEAKDAGTLLALNVPQARQATLDFWSRCLASGARFEVPEKAVNALFRANLWHALRLPRRHGGAGDQVDIDLPYSNFAYDQLGTPWPVNQSVYVDYMIYDLRGYHAIAAEELAMIYRNNQEANGHIKGYANWGVYTPGMMYSVAKNYLLSRDRAGFEALLPATLRALDWCLAEMKQAAQRPGPTAGLILAPLNDLSHEPRAWAFNQAYFFAGVDLLGQALADIGHPRAAECQAAAIAMRRAVERGFGHASMRSPLVQLRDRTWSPYVPCDALAARHLYEVWYPTEVDTGALHLSRLRALDPNGALTTCLLNDHEDNLFCRGWGMANEPVYNQHATAYLLRDDPKAVIRAFYSMMACAFSHTTFEPVEHRWAWGQYFGPPSTDGAWFELYRHMLVNELSGDGTLFVGQAVPRAWLADGKRIRVERAPTYYGPVSFTVESHTATGEIAVFLDTPMRQRPAALLVRLRHPQQKPLQSVTVNGQTWTDFDTAKEWVRIPNPAANQYTIVARY